MNGEPLAHAEALLAVNRPAEALEFATAAAAGSPSDPRPHILAASAHTALGAYGHARRAAERALALEPTSVAAMRLRAVARFGSGDSSGALSDAEAAMRANPEDPESSRLVSAILLRRGRKKAAERIAEQAVRLAPGDAGTHVALGEALQAQERLRAAEQAYRAALRLDAEHSNAVANLGTVTALLGDRMRGAQLVQMGAAINAGDEYARRRVVSYARGGAGGLATWPIIVICGVEAGAAFADAGSPLASRLVLGGVLAACSGALLALRVGRERHLSRDVRRFVHRQWRTLTLLPLGRTAGYRPWWWSLAARIPIGGRAGLAVAAFAGLFIGRFQAGSDRSAGSWVVTAAVGVIAAYTTWRFARIQRIRLEPHPLYGTPATTQDG